MCGCYEKKLNGHEKRGEKGKNPPSPAGRGRPLIRVGNAATTRVTLLLLFGCCWFRGSIHGRRRGRLYVDNGISVFVLCPSGKRVTWWSTPPQPPELTETQRVQVDAE